MINRAEESVEFLRVLEGKFKGKIKIKDRFFVTEEKTSYTLPPVVFKNQVS